VNHLRAILATAACVAFLGAAPLPVSTLTFHVPLNYGPGGAVPRPVLAKLYAELAADGPTVRRPESGAWFNPSGQYQRDRNENVQVTVPSSRALAVARAFLQHEKVALKQEVVLGEIYPAQPLPGDARVTEIAMVSLDKNPCSASETETDLRALSKIAGGASAYQHGSGCRVYSDIARAKAHAVVAYFNHDAVQVRNALAVRY